MKGKDNRGKFIKGHTLNQDENHPHMITKAKILEEFKELAKADNDGMIQGCTTYGVQKFISDKIDSLLDEFEVEERKSPYFGGIHGAYSNENVSGYNQRVREEKEIIKKIKGQ